MRVTIACPEGLVENANHLASCVGLCKEDAYTYNNIGWEDAEGTSYSVISAVVGESFFLFAEAELQEPLWGADVEKATQAQKALKFDQKASKDSLTVVVGEDVEAAIALLEVVRKKEEKNETYSPSLDSGGTLS